MKQWLLEAFELKRVRNKILILSKVTGVAITVFYLLVAELPITPTSSFWIWLVLLMAVMLIVNVFLGKIVTKPLISINETAKRIAKLDFSKECTVVTNDEYGELSANLNRMSNNLQQALIDIEKANKQLEKDVEQERQLLCERKEFVDTLSHEMKTPLGVIRAYTEGLRDEVDETKRTKYMSVIIEETERINYLIVSLLDLSALEAGASKLTLERFDFIELVETVAGRLLIDVPDRNYHFTYELPQDKMYVFSDEIRTEEVLENLIMNAKKHVVLDGVIKLSVKQSQSMLKCTIYNQGDNIEEENLSKIWTKFYRSKQSQKNSGSGLGLAIVAQILSMQGLSYGAKNLSGGVEFYFTLPIA